jgi:hypothetical protein
MEEKNTNPIPHYLLIKKGIHAGIASIFSNFTYPLEFIKIRYHVIEDKNLKKGLILRIIRQEGIMALWKGVNQNVICGFFGYGLIFYFYEVFFYILKKQFNINNIINSIISSLTAGMIGVTLISPFNYIKTRQILCLDKSHYGIKKIIKEIYNENKSIFSFWRALQPSLCTAGYSAIQIFLYHTLKERFLKDNTDLKKNSVLGMISRSFACTVIFPFQLLRSRILNYQKENQKSINKIPFSETTKVYRQLYKDLSNIIFKEGFTTLFRGLQFELVKVSINGALFFYSYEYLNKTF